MSEPILTVSHLCKQYRIPGTRRYLNAVNDVSFSIMPGETFGLVGESGCGKSTIAKLILCLEPPTKGQILFMGTDLNALSERERRPLRPRLQMVFQDSGSSLNPRKRIRDILSEPMLHHRVCPPSEMEKRIDDLLSQVGLSPQAKSRYPHEFSGGQRQRICIARALSLDPQLIVLDEPVSALDVSVQAQILNLLRDLQKERNLTYLFIGHGLGAVHYLSTRMAVMYRGELVETGQSDALFDAPVHPYTRSLFDAAPIADYDLRDRKRSLLVGEVGDPVPEGACPLYPRCPLRETETCQHYHGRLTPVAGDDTHLSCCHKAGGVL